MALGSHRLASSFLSFFSLLYYQLIKFASDFVGVTVKGGSVSVPTGAAGLAAIDTGTTLIGGPTDAVQAVYAQIPNSQPLTGSMEGFYQFRESPLR